MAKTNFLPETDGFAFSNTSWMYDDFEKAKLRDMFSTAVPAAIGALAPLLLAAGGPVIAPVLGIAEPIIDLAIALAGPLLPLILWEAGNAITNSILTSIEGNGFGLCAGMTSAALDYYMLQWVVPRGIGPLDNPTRTEDGGSDAGTMLRNYLWERLLDSHENNGVTFLTWIAMLQFFGDSGATWVLQQTKDHWVTIKSALDAGNPALVCLVAPSINPMDSHVVLAIDYENRGYDPRILHLYDNNHPDERTHIEIRFGGPRLVANESSGEQWAGIFAGAYSPKLPPLALGVSKQLEIDPQNCLNSGQPLACSFGATNASYQTLESLRLAVNAGDATGEEANVHSIAVNTTYTPPADNLIVKDWEPGPKVLQPGCIVQGKNKQGKYDPALVAWKVLPLLDGTPAETKDIFVTPSVRIHDRLGHFGPGGAVALIADLAVTLPAGLSVTGYEWTYTGDVIIHSNSPTLIVVPPPAYDTSFAIDVAVTFSNGCTAHGHLDDFLLSPEDNQRIARLLALAHEVIRSFGSINPLGDPVGFLSGAVIPTQSDITIAGEVVRRLGQLH